MSVDLHVPLVNQLIGGANYRPPTDGAPDNNSGWDCGEADFCAIVSWFGGPTLNPDEVKDKVLGPGAVNAPSQMDSYRGLAAKYGLAITTVTGDAATLLGRARSEIAAGHPVVILIPSLWGREPPPPQGVGSLHFVVLEADTGSGLVAMNPWGGFYHGGSYGYWQERVRDGAIWVFSREGSVSGGMLDINNPTVQEWFYQEASGAWKCRQTGYEIAMGMLDTYRGAGGTLGGQLAGLTLLGLPKSNIVYPGHGGIQYFERGALVWDPKRELDNPPGVSGDYYLAHLDSGLAQQFYAGAVATELVQAKQELATAQEQLTAAQTQDASDKAAASAAAAADASDKAAAAKAEQELAAAQQQMKALTAQVEALEEQITANTQGAAVVAALRTIRAAMEEPAVSGAPAQPQTQSQAPAA